MYGQRLLLTGWLVLSLVGTALGQSPADDIGTAVLQDFSGSGAIGRTNFNVQNVSGDGVGWRNGFTQIGAFTPLFYNGEWLLAPNGRLMITDTQKVGGNAGLIGRYYSSEWDRLFGANVYYDWDRAAPGFTYNQIGFGAETLGNLWDFRANGYAPIGNRENIVGPVGIINNPYFFQNWLAITGLQNNQRSLAGGDFEFGVPLSARTPWLRLYGGAYFYDGPVDDPRGYRLRTEAWISDDLSVSLNVTDDRVFGTNFNTVVNWTFGGFKPTRYFPNLTTRDRMFQQAQRNWRVATTEWVTKVPVPIINPRTNLPYFFTHVDNSSPVPGAGTGTFEDPFKAVPGASPAADVVLVRTGTSTAATPYLTNIALTDHQRLWGEGLARQLQGGASFGPFVVPVQTYNVPTLTNTGLYPWLQNPGGDAVTLASNNDVSGFNINGSAGNAIAGPAGNINNFNLYNLNLLGNGGGISLPAASGIGLVNNVLTAGNAGPGMSFTSGTSGLQVYVSNSNAGFNNVGMRFITGGSNLQAFLDGTSQSNNNVTGVGVYGSAGRSIGLYANGFTANNNTAYGIYGEFAGVGTVGGINLFNQTATGNGSGGPDPTYGGVYVNGNTGSTSSLVVTNSNISSNVVNNIRTDAASGATMDVFIDPTLAINAGQYGYFFNVTDAGTVYRSLVMDTDFSTAPGTGVYGYVDSGAVADVTLQRVTARNTGFDGASFRAVNGGVINSLAINASNFSNDDGFSTGNGLSLVTTNGGRINTAQITNTYLHGHNPSAGLGTATGLNLTNVLGYQNVVADNINVSRSGFAGIFLTNFGGTSLLSANNLQGYETGVGLGAATTAGGRTGIALSNANFTDTGVPDTSVGIAVSTADLGSRTDLALSNIIATNRGGDGMLLSAANQGITNVFGTGGVFDFSRAAANGINIQAVTGGAVGLELSNLQATDVGFNGLRFTGDASSVISANLSNSRLDRAGQAGIPGSQSAVQGLLTNGSTGVLNLTNVSANNARGAGLRVSTNSGSQLVSNIADTTFNDAGALDAVDNTGVEFNTDGAGSLASISLQNVSAANAGGHGLLATATGGAGVFASALSSDFSNAGQSAATPSSSVRGVTTDPASFLQMDLTNVLAGNVAGNATTFNAASFVGTGANSLITNINGGSYSAAAAEGININSQNGSTVLANITGAAISDNGNDGVQVNSGAAATAILQMQSNQLGFNGGYGVSATANSSNLLAVTMIENILDENNHGVLMSSNATGQTLGRFLSNSLTSTNSLGTHLGYQLYTDFGLNTFVLGNNTLTGFNAGGLTAQLGGTAATDNFLVNNNTFNASSGGVPVTLPTSDGINLRLIGNSVTGTAAINTNTVAGWGNAGIIAQLAGAATVGTLKIDPNLVQNNGGDGISVVTDATGGPYTINNLIVSGLPSAQQQILNNGGTGLVLALNNVNGLNTFDVTNNTITGNTGPAMTVTLNNVNANGVINISNNTASGNAAGDLEFTIVGPTNPATVVALNNNTIANGGVIFNQINANLNSVSLSDNTVTNAPGNGVAYFLDSTSTVVNVGMNRNTVSWTGTTVPNRLNGVLFDATSGAQVQTVYMDNNTITNAGFDGLRMSLPSISGLTRLSATGNAITDSGRRGITLIAPNAPINGMVTVSDNLVENSGQDGILVNLFNSPFVVLGADRNRISESDGFGLRIVSGHTSPAAASSISVSNNNVGTSLGADGTTGTNDADGIRLELGNMTVNNLYLRSNTIASADGDGLRLISSGLAGPTPINNLFITDNAVGASTRHGINLQLTSAPVNSFLVQGNQIGLIPGVGPGAIDDTLPVIRAGFNANTLAANDDGSTAAIPIGFNANFFGLNFNSVFVNNNGNFTFDQPLPSFTPFNLLTQNRAIIAPFFADVDTRAGNIVSFGNGTVGGRNAFAANWLDVRHFSATNPANTGTTNRFQAVLVDRSDTGAGNFDIEFNYERVLWESGTASGGNNAGLGGSSARAGFSNGSTDALELAGSAVNGAFLDSGPAATSLIQNSLNSIHNGRYVFFSRNGSFNGGVAANGGDGIHMELVDSDIGTHQILNNQIVSSGQDGLDIIATNSRLHTTGGEIEISGNNIRGSTGDAVRLVGPSTRGDAINLIADRNQIGVQTDGTTASANTGRGFNIDLRTGLQNFSGNFTNNIISNSGSDAILTQLAAGRSQTVLLDGNTISNNNGFGFRTSGTTGNTINLLAGTQGQVAAANLMNSNQGAGIAIDLQQNAIANVNIQNTTISGTRVGAAGADLFVPGDAASGSGLALRAVDNAAINLTVGAANDFNTAFNNNARHGVYLLSGSFSQINAVNATGATPTQISGPIFRNSNYLNNTGNGLHIDRQGQGVINNAQITRNTFNSNASGIFLAARNANSTDTYTITGNQIGAAGAGNRVNGITLVQQADADIVANISANRIQSNLGDGINASSLVSSSDSAFLTGTWSNNLISGNGGDGIDVTSAHQLTIGGAVGNNISNNTGNGINISGSSVNVAAGSIVTDTISNNVINTNGANGVLINSIGANNVTISGNTVSDNTGDGVQLSSSGVRLIANLQRNIIQANDGDGVQAVFSGTSGTNPFLGPNVVNVGQTNGTNGNLITDNGRRGINVLNQGNANSVVTANNNSLLRNRLEGIYAMNTPAAGQTADAGADVAPVLTSDFTAVPQLTLNVGNGGGNAVRDNGLGQLPNSLGATGLVVRVGTADAAQGPGAAGSNDGGTGRGAYASTGRAGVIANVSNNLFGGNFGADVTFQPFIATNPPPTTTGEWDNNTEPDPVPSDNVFRIDSFTQDPLARLDLIFTGNTGEELDGSNATAANAFYNNNEDQFKSRTVGATPAGPFLSGTRARNATILASRNAPFDPPTAVPTGFPGFLYPGVDGSATGSTFRLRTTGPANNFGISDGFNNVQIGVGFGELNFNWDNF